MKLKKESKVLIGNTISLYLMSIAKIILPLISLPYLVRVLSVDCYGAVSFVKSLITYMQILIDFGFMLSATKDIALIVKNGGDPAEEIGHTLYAQMMLSGIAAIIMLVCCFIFPIMKGMELYGMLSFINCALTMFLFEYVFKAYEKMGAISFRFLIMKVISVLLTIIFVKSDADIILMPIFDILATLVAILFMQLQLRKMGVKIAFHIKKIKEGLISLKKSFIYFISNFATTAFSALNTLIIGLMLAKSDVAYWSITTQMIGVVSVLYNPIITSVFPNMVKNKDLKVVHKILLVYLPLIFIGCTLILLFADPVVTFVFGKNYLTSSLLLKHLIPLLIFSFLSQLYGWPCLGAINKQKEATLTTIIAAIFQVIFLVVLILINEFSLFTICIARNATEFVLFILRFITCYKNKSLFVNTGVKVNKVLDN